MAVPTHLFGEVKNKFGGEARSRGGLGKGALAMSVAPESGRNRIMIYGPKKDGTYIVEFWAFGAQI
jgi:hypothetical protein